MHGGQGRDRLLAFTLCFAIMGIMKLYTFRTIIEPEATAGYHGFVPFLKGVHTYGKTLDEVKKNLREAILCHIQGLLKDHEAVPQEEEAFELIQSFSEREFVAVR